MLETLLRGLLSGTFVVFSTLLAFASNICVGKSLVFIMILYSVKNFIVS